ncbi:hypothetical protein MMC25_007217 [Agyrium rufum]|nr:hypothetical protein [Agyrium rufum]
MLEVIESKPRSGRLHPYLSGNFAPIHRTQRLLACSYTGTIPAELGGGQYVRNGGNPVTNEELGRDAHWFDGDGMLSGVSFRRTGDKDTEVQPEFVNQYVLTDVLISQKTSRFLRTPVLPSIATLVNPLSSLVTIILRIFRTLLLVLLSHLPGSQQAIKRISVANTAILYHDGRALATCESGPPMRVALPSLDTIGWFNGKWAEGEMHTEAGSGFGGDGLLSFMKEWTTAHPRVDPETHELISFHATFAPPYIHYSIIPANKDRLSNAPLMEPTRLLTAPVAGVSSAKMMHDFGVSKKHTIIMDLPLSLDPLNLAKNKPVVAYDPTARSRFGVFSRYEPDRVRWFETNACCIFHTANTWDTTEKDPTSIGQEVTTVNMIACRLTSASLVFRAGDLEAPEPTAPIPASMQEVEQCRLYYYQFPLSSQNPNNLIPNQWALSAVPFEFPTIRESASMSAARYVYGCSLSEDTFGAALGKAAKIDSLVKMDVLSLIARGKRNPPTQIKGCVDTRSVAEVLASHDPADPIKIFKLPTGWYAQEASFVPRLHSDNDKPSAEDDGWLLTYVFDESQLDAHGECPPDAKSELWIIDAKNMRDVVARVRLPQRVPYGLHGHWFSEEDICGQRPVEGMRSLPLGRAESEKEKTWVGRAWMGVRRRVEWYLA